MFFLEMDGEEWKKLKTLNSYYSTNILPTLKSELKISCFSC